MTTTTATTTHLDGTIHTTELRTAGARALRAAQRASRGAGVAKVVVTTATSTRTYVAGKEVRAGEVRPADGRRGWVVAWRTAVMPASAFWSYATKREALAALAGLAV